ncbi:MAG: D-alanine--D-alanine ligase [Fluviicola sp.]|jgi:D-alanine-D-alanine ligase
MKRIGLFCGGYSSEFEISMKSAATIAANFPKEYEIIQIEVTKSGWFAHKDGQRLPFSLDTCGFSWNGNTVSIDAGLIYIHGNPGENGKIQAYLDLKGIPYVNSPALASELSFDKWYCNQFLKNFGIPVAKSLFLRSANEFSADHIISELGLPCFVKPSDSGSSYGISKVQAKEELNKALEVAFAEGGTVVIESFLKGTEVTCGVYRRKDGLHALPLTEIASENEFFDYEAKYLGKSQEITPARIPDIIRDIVQARAKYCYDLLQLRSIARIDFMIVDNEPYVIEVNTTPGFSPASIVPQMLACDGISIHDFWKEILSVELK